MLIAADIGNSAIKFGVFNTDRISNPVCSFTVANNAYRSSDEYELLIRQLLLTKGFTAPIRNSVISSVAPSVTMSVKNALTAITDSDPFIIGSGTRTGFRICIDDPAELGADIVSNAAATLQIAEGPIVIADLGTATTLTVINASNELIGSVIIPGAGLSLSALSNTAELLKTVNFKHPKHLIGTNTADSITSGIINGNIFMIDGFIRNIREQLCGNGQKLTLIATGGISEAIIPYCRNKFTTVKNLTLLGSAYLYTQNRK